MNQASSGPSTLRRTATRLAVPILFTVVLWAAHRPGFPAPLYLDSSQHLTQKTNLHMVEVTPQSLDDAIRRDFRGPVYRPVSSLSLALTHRLFGADWAAFRTVNLAVHWAAALALYFLLSEVLRSSRARRTVPLPEPWLGRAALVAVLLWAAHPVQTNVVAYLIQRMASLAGLFTFLAVGCYLRARRAGPGWHWGWGTAAAPAALLGLGSKESAATVVLLAAAAEAALLDRPAAPGVRRGLRLAWLGLAAAGLAALAWRGPEVWASLQPLAETRSFNTWERVLTEARIQINYLLVLLIPDPRLLTLDAEIPVSRGLFSPPATAAMVFAVAAALGWAAARRKKHPLAAFCVLWFLLAQAVEATVLPLELYFEHRMYVPAAGLFLGMGVLWARWASAGRTRRRAAVLLVAATLGVELLGTATRSALWARPLAFYMDNAAKAPNKSRVLGSLGLQLTRAGLYQEAQDALTRALEQPNPDPSVHLALSRLAFERGDLSTAKAWLERYIALDSARANRATGYYLLAAVERASGDLPAAFAALKKSLAARPRDADTLQLLGEVLLDAAKPAEAVKALDAAASFNPASAEIADLLAEARRRAEKPEGRR